ncbi:asparaginase domain-containing protein [Reinekea thalattae]|uniref:Asparaginase n=1 Tax=Reinekea thalattae TaxID=2593301 RepID=A0A5C8ZAE4_9GAMM|nr:asparaginase domain-containing protein [Reinekea thalattae]TXR53790.1 hypothetical protein FME95_04325 [Reinekea thalattae]
MSHFLIINTGGTIGMTQGENGLEPKAGELERALNSNHPDLAEWQQHSISWKHWQPLLDSSELQPENWFQIRKDILEAPEEIDGFLVIHGTDTLAFSAAALSYLMSGFDKPIVMTGAMLPVSAEGTDATANLKLALKALTEQRNEVVVAVGPQTLPGSRVTKTSTSSFSAFSSPNWHESSWQQPSSQQPLSFSKPWKKHSIAVITLFPGLSIEPLMTPDSWHHRAILINALGNGNAASTTEFLRFLKTAKEKNIPVFVRSQCLDGEVDFSLYAAGSLFKDCGAISCGTMTFESAITKIQLLCSEFETAEEIVTAFQQPLAREWQKEV